jgi:glycosyltransferase involved in cell wall biosynthesis
MPPRISVVIAAYRPGTGFDRVMDSLDAQTLPQEEFETIVVDDGSPDDTFDRLSALAATRPNMRVERIENSGWPSRPRNVATALARGEYVLFMDHDDSLYPDALRRMAEYATETRADVLSPKESKTSDAWWGMPALVDGNVPNALTEGGIDRLLPMVPHKLYRRAFLQEHGISFPEGRRQLWEDIYVNVAAWRRAERVAVLADTPVYLWHSSATNNSKTYGPRTEEFWDRLDELFAFIDTTLDSEAFADARRSALLHQYRSRVLLRLSRNLNKATAEESATAMARARALQERYIPEAWDAGLTKQVRARSILLRADRPDLLVALWAVDADSACRVTATEVAWQDGRLHLQLTARWLDKSGAPIGLVREGDRLFRALPPELRAALPDDVVDFSDTLDLFRLDVGVRDRPASVTWQLTLDQEARWTDLEDGRVAPELTATAVLDPATVALGAPLAASVHDVLASLRWDGAGRAGAVRYSGQAAPAVLAGGTAVAYRSQKGALALDTSARLRNVIADGAVPTGRVPGELSALRLPLPRIAVFAPAAPPAAAKLHRAGRAGEIVLDGALVAEAGGAHLELAAPGPIPDGQYLVSFRLGDGPFLGERPAKVSRDALTILPRTSTGPVARVLGPAVGRVVRTLRGRRGV